MLPSLKRSKYRQPTSLRSAKNGPHAYRLSPQTPYQPVESLSFTVLLLRELCHDAHTNLRVRHGLRFQYVIIVFRVFLFRAPVTRTAQAFPIRFLPAAVQPRPVYDYLPVFPLILAFSNALPRISFFTSLRTVSCCSSRHTPFR